MQGTNIKPFMQSKTALKVVSTPDTPAGRQRRGRDMNKKMAFPVSLPPSPFSVKTSGSLATHCFRIEMSWMKASTLPTCSNKQLWRNYLCSLGTVFLKYLLYSWQRSNFAVIFPAAECTRKMLSKLPQCELDFVLFMMLSSFQIKNIFAENTELFFVSRKHNATTFSLTLKVHL